MQRGQCIRCKKICKSQHSSKISFGEFLFIGKFVDKLLAVGVVAANVLHGFDLTECLLDFDSHLSIFDEHSGDKVSKVIITDGFIIVLHFNYLFDGLVEVGVVERWFSDIKLISDTAY
jgi:hypothetical protein